MICYKGLTYNKTYSYCHIYNGDIHHSIIVMHNVDTRT